MAVSEARWIEHPARLLRFGSILNEPNNGGPDASTCVYSDISDIMSST
jgi:hypothetical protein